MSKRYQFDYDINDRITGFTNGFWSQSFGYDDLYRLTTANSPGLGNQTFIYDANGNRKTHVQGGNTAYAIANTNNRLTVLSGSANRSYTYTPTGHVKTITGFGGGGETIFRNGFQIEPLPVTTYGYNPFDRLTSVTGPGITASFQLGADGTRYQKTANGETTRFVYGRGGQLLSEHRQSPARWTNYLWLNGEPVALVRDNALYWIQNDHLGRPEGITDQNRQRVWRANLRAFDRKVITDDLGGFHLGFPGQYHDTETGHAYNIHRDYDPGTGRYLRSDPIGLAGGINTYAYALSNPVSVTDPLGLEGIGPWTFAPGPMRDDYYGNTRIPGIVLGSAGDFIGTYVNQTLATHWYGAAHNGWANQDKYFHCKANCAAAQRGQAGSQAARCMSDARESFDQFMGDPPSASVADQIANSFGRTGGAANPSGSCQQICGSLRPGGTFPAHY